MGCALGIVGIILLGALESNPIVAVLVAVALAAAIVLAFFRDQNVEARKKQEAAAYVLGKCTELGASAWVQLSLVYGLSLPKGALCELYVAQGTLHVQAESLTLRINMQRISAAQVVTDSELTKETQEGETGPVPHTLDLGTLANTIQTLKPTSTPDHKRSKTRTEATYYVVINHLNDWEKTDVLAFEGTWDDCSTLVAALPFGTQTP